MKKSRALWLWTAAALSGCASAAPRTPPADVVTGRVYTNPVEVGTFAATADLERVLPTSLARYGYSIAQALQPTAEHVQFVTEWREHDHGRTRLVLDARKRGPRFTLSIYAITYVQDAGGGWHEAGPNDQVRSEVRELSRNLALAIR